MNIDQNVNIAGRFEAETMRILAAIPGLSVTARPDASHDLEATISYGDRIEKIAVKVKTKANAATAWQVVHQATQSELPQLLVARDTTAEARSILSTHGVGVVDASGYASIKLPGLMILISPQKSLPDTTKQTAARLTGKAGVVAQALLVEPQRAWKINDLATFSTVSPSLVHRVCVRLELEGLLTSQGKGPQRVRTVTNATALLDLFAEEDHERTRDTPAHVLSQSTAQLTSKIAGQLEAAGIRYAVGGASAANIVSPFLTSVPVLKVVVDEMTPVNDVLSVTDASEVDAGNNVVFAQSKSNAALAFRRPVEELWVMNLFRLYIDLRKDPRRGKEQAEHLRREVIRF